MADLDDMLQEFAHMQEELEQQQQQQREQQREAREAETLHREDRERRGHAGRSMSHIAMRHRTCQPGITSGQHETAERQHETAQNYLCNISNFDAR